MIAPSDITAVILAGGFGTRLKGLLGDLPKPMAPVNGRPFVEWIVRWLKAQHVHDVIISTGYRAEKVEKHFAITTIPTMKVRCVAEPKPMGTGGGLTYSTAACESKPQAWLVLNGDSLVFFDLDKITVSLGNAEGVIMTRAVPDTSRYGSVRTDDTGRITAFEEKQPGSGHINAGIYLLRHDVLRDFPSHCPLSLESEVFPSLLSRNAGLRAHQVEAPFLDIGTPETLLQAEAFIEDNQAQFA